MASKTLVLENGDPITAITGAKYNEIKAILLKKQALLKWCLLHQSPSVSLQLKVEVLESVEAYWHQVGKMDGELFYYTRLFFCAH